MSRWWAIVLALALVGVLTGAASGTSRHAGLGQRPVPEGFVGMVVDDPVWPDPFVNLPDQLGTMVSSGVETLRVTFDWGAAQPYPNWKAVPSDQKAKFTNVGGVPTDFSWIDQMVGLAAARKLTLLPVILNAPTWDGIHRKGGLVLIPRHDAPYAAFLTAMVNRYGPHGSFWASNPSQVKTPITMWQIWNEPNIFPFWPILPFEKGYLPLLKAARAAIKSVDPNAKVVLAGMPNYSWIDLANVYKHRGARSLFDVVAVHPYTRDPAGVITILRYVRQTMDRAGDASKPLIADEVSWPSSEGQTSHDTGYDFATTEAGQAENIQKLLPMLVHDRASLGLQAFYYYDWAGLERQNALAFEFSGLFRFSGGQFTAKPAYSTFRDGALAIEGCRAKGQLTTSCLKSG
jgi:hypothetical protein